MEGFATFLGVAVIIGGILYGLKVAFDKYSKKRGTTKRGTNSGPKLP